MSKLDVKDFNSQFAFGLARQFHGMWKMLRQGIEKIPDEQWTFGKDKWFYSLRVYHIIETFEFYARDTHKGMQWGKRLGKVNWWETMSHKEVASLITKKDALAYLGEMEEHTTKLFKANTDEDLLKEDDFHWFSSIYEKFLYCLRHNSFHIGELAFALNRLECERIEWS
ncbi:MAG: DinB family protein [Candidatus Hermodarchaeia archaeon]|jgi:hypothetical protein